MESPQTERRRAPRIDCQIPVLLHGKGRSLHATSADLSRVGTLLRLPVAELGLPPGARLVDVAREAVAVLGDHIRVDLHHEILGALIQRTARMIRVARRDLSGDVLEVGIDLLKPLSDMEVDFLGLPLPPLFHEVDVTWEPRGTPAEPRDLAVVFCAEDETRAPPLRILPAYLDAEGARADLGRLENLPLLVDGLGAADVLTALADVYGAEPRAVIFSNALPVWSGTARLEAVEVSAQHRRVKLEVGFPRRLPPGARERLGLAA